MPVSDMEGMQKKRKENTELLSMLGGDASFQQCYTSRHSTISDNINLMHLALIQNAAWAQQCFRWLMPVTSTDSNCNKYNDSAGHCSGGQAMSNIAHSAFRHAHQPHGQLLGVSG